MGKIVSRAVNYGSLSPNEYDGNGNVFFGAGNVGTSGWHAKQLWNEPLPLEIAFAKMFGLPIPQPTIEASVGLKVHYRTGEDALPTNSNGIVYNVDGGYQQDGVHNASGTNEGRASWNVDFSLFDKDGEFTNAYVWVDINPTIAKDYLKFQYDEDVDALVATDSNGNLRFLGTGNGPENVQQDSINLMFFADLIDNDGNAGNGVQAWDMESGQFDFQIGLYDGNAVQTNVTVNVGPMLDAMM